MNEKSLKRYRKDPNMMKGIVDEQKAAQKSTVAIQKITPRVRKLLELIMERQLIVMLKYAGTDSADVPAKVDHKNFPTRCHDGAAITLALAENTFPKNFAVPIGGGIPFLEHVADCAFCLSLIADEDDADEETVVAEGKEILADLGQEYERRRKIN